MNEAIPKNKRDEVAAELVAILKKHNLPANIGIRQAIDSLMKEVSCQHQLATDKA